MTANPSAMPCNEIDLIDLSRMAMPLRRWSAIATAARSRSGGACSAASPTTAAFFHQAEEVELACFGRCTAIARVALSAAGMWFAGYEYFLFDSGGGYFPSVADREAYPTRDDAIRAITDDLRFVFLHAASTSGNPENIRTQAQKMFEMLKARLDPPAQFDLFSLQPTEQERRTINISPDLAEKNRGLAIGTLLCLEDKLPATALLQAAFVLHRRDP
jgi:hypothetical protein